MDRQTVFQYFQLIVQKGKSSGLSMVDYEVLTELLTFLQPSDELYEKINVVIRYLLQNEDFFNYSKESIAYINTHTYLLPLVLANNEKEVNLSGDNSYLFWCQFEDEDKPAMSVSDIKNLMHCFICNRSFNAITYLQAKEGLSFFRALDILTQVFCLEETRVKTDALVLKYQEMLLHPIYAKFLSQGFDRLVKRNITVLDELPIETAYIERFSTIMRVRRREIDPEFSRLKEKKLVFLDASL